jgi:glutamate synthase domain-containing protein 2
MMIQVGIADYHQPIHSLERALPVVAHIRRFAELIREEIRQYFFENDEDGRPANRLERNQVYRLSKGEKNEIGLGTTQDYSKIGEVHVPPSGHPVPDHEPIKFAPIIMGADLPHPAYLYGRFGISDMSFGSLGRAAVEAFTSGARYGMKFVEEPGSNREIRGLMSTGEGGLTPYHLNGVYIEPTRTKVFAWKAATALSHLHSGFRPEPLPRVGNLGCGDIVWEVGTGNFSCRTADGGLDLEEFLRKASDPRVIAIKWKISQGAKPGCGAMLPGDKVTEEVSQIRGIPMGQDCHSPNTRNDWHDIPSMMAFLADKRKRTGKPQLIKFAVGDRQWLKELCEYIADPSHERALDGIHIDGGEGGTGAAPQAIADRVGMSIWHAIPLVDNMLREHGIRDQLVLISSAKAFTPGQLYIQLCLGANYVMGARGPMMALGCIQSGKCHLGECVVGITTHHEWLQHALNTRVKYRRMANYMEGMHKELIRFLRIRGKRDTLELTRDDITFNEQYDEVPGTKAYPYPQNCQGVVRMQTPRSCGLPQHYDPRVHATIADAIAAQNAGLVPA